MKKKITGICLIGLLAALLATGCGNSGSGSGTENEETAAPAQTEALTDGPVDEPGGADDGVEQIDSPGDDGVFDADEGGELPDGAIPEDQDEAAALDSTAWGGTYATDQETLTITAGDDTSFSFSFANSVISGTATVNGSTAVYSGDDGHTINFAWYGTTIEVSVDNEDGNDTSASILNGTFVRQ